MCLVIGSTLHSASQVSLSVGLLSVILASWMTLSVLRKRQGKSGLMPWKKILAALGMTYPISAPNSESRATWLEFHPGIYKAAFVMTVFAFLASLHLLYQEYRSGDVYEDHNLKIVRIVGQYSWLVERSDGAVTRLDFCKNFDVSQLEPQPGYVIETIRAHDQGCLNIIPASKYLITWKKDSQGWTWKGDN